MHDKRDNFPFEIVRMSDLSGNIPSTIFYGTILSEILRIARCTFLYKDFVPRVQSMAKRMVNQGASKENIWKQILKVQKKHPEAFLMYGKNNIEIANDILSFR